MASITAYVQFADRINPARFNFSPMLTAIVGGIIDHDYGVRDRKGGKLGHLSITSDGYVIATSTAHESGAFLCAASDLERNIAAWKSGLAADDQAAFESLYARNVNDWR